MRTDAGHNKSTLEKIVRATFNDIAGIFSLKKHLPDLDKKDMRRITESFADENFRQLPAMAALGLIFSVVFIIGDINTDFYRQNFPVSVLNMIFEGLYFFAGLAAVVVCGMVGLSEKTVSARFKIIFHELYYVCASLASGLGYVSESLRGQRSIVPLFFIIYFGTIVTMPLELYFFCFAFVFLPALIAQAMTGMLEAAEILTAVGSFLFFFFNRTLYLRYRITQQELEKANSELTEITVTDPLTKAGNRTRLYRIFDCCKDEWLKKKLEVCLVMCDIDNFKNYNDTYSHLKGDECLVKVTDAIMKSFPADGTFCELIRFGGEEFLIVMAGRELHGKLDDMYRRMSGRIEALHLPSGKGAVHEYVTVSFGADISCFDGRFVPEDRIRSADSQLYISKNNGRNRLTVTPSPTEKRAV